MKLCAAIALIGAGTILASVVMTVLAVMNGMDMESIRTMMGSNAGNIPSVVLRGMLWAQAIAGFLLPAFLFGRLFYRRNWKQYFHIHIAPSIPLILLGILTLFTAYPLVQLSYELNSILPLPDWMHDMEGDATEVMQQILSMNNVGSFLLTVLLVGILPGIGEELIFRGIIQRQLQDWTGRPVLAIWIAAIIFSAIHMQFEGFLPRIALGAVLGFLYLWSNNLWVPMIVHAFNNGAQVAVLYFTGTDLSNVEEQSTMPLNAGIVILSVVLLFLYYLAITKFRIQRDG